MASEILQRDVARSRLLGKDTERNHHRHIVCPGPPPGSLSVLPG